ncbi:hypothetical protein IWX49DRAFT_622252, partial [Phyllosticta citricarpa]
MADTPTTECFQTRARRTATSLRILGLDSLGNGCLTAGAGTYRKRNLLSSQESSRKSFHLLQVPTSYSPLSTSPRPNRLSRPRTWKFATSCVDGVGPQFYAHLPRARGRGAKTGFRKGSSAVSAFFMVIICGVFPFGAVHL